MTKSSKKRSKSASHAKAMPPQTLSEEQKAQRAKDEALKQTLTFIQDRIKRTPELYKKEFNTHFETFKNSLTQFKTNPGKRSEEIINYCLFFSHISAVFKVQIVEFLSTELLNILQQYYSILHPDNRMAMVTSLKILRGKDVVSPTLILPVFFKLFKCKDKELRSYLNAQIINDLKQLNKTHRNHAVNRKLQNFVFEMLQDPNETATKRALSVMIDLYKRKIWNDDKTVNVIAQACLHDNPKVVASSAKFFLVLDYVYESESENDSSGEDDKKLILGKYKGTKKMTKGRLQKVDRAIKQHKRKEKRKNKTKSFTDFLPIDLINDPQSFVEKLFNKLRKSNDRYEVKLLLMRLISRMIGRHQLMLMPFYPHLIRYLQSHDKEKIGEIFAMIIESCHELVPPEEIKPIIEKIITNYITEYCNNQHITIGLNAIREILMRMPLALDESQIEYLVLFRTFKNSSVVGAAKSLINYFRDVCPNLLPKKLRGRFTKIDDDNAKENYIYGKQRISYGIEGIELLQKSEGIDESINMAATRILDDTDLKKLRILKLRQAVKKIDRKGFASSGEEEEEKESEKDESEEDSGDEEELSEGEEGEEEQDEGDEDEDQANFEEGSSIEYDGEFEADGEEGEDEEEESQEEEEVVESRGRVKEADKKRSKSVEVKSKAKLNITKDSKKTNKTKFQDSSSGSEDDEEMSEEVNPYHVSSSELEQTSEEENVHGFVYAHNLDTYRKSKREKIEIQMKEREENKDEHKDKFKKKKDKKKGGDTNKKKLKHKPFGMVKQKKLKSINDKLENTKTKLKKLRVQLGKYKKNQKSKFEAKKKRLRMK